jgi:hypothetical protein
MSFKNFSDKKLQKEIKYIKLSHLINYNDLANLVNRNLKGLKSYAMVMHFLLSDLHWD